MAWQPQSRMTFYLETLVLHGRLHKFFSEMAFVSTFGAHFVAWYSYELTVCTPRTHGTHLSM